ncbi:hypothetical protein DYB37_004314 [Aphanomyces astaci]|uniref:Uncharacterized protein n=1 Tax=Aphanomyces astaci TaxID=112090 RepID=A0A3R7BKJ3_APHAT|nr:hypothetical protein DYB35_001891 [Aphanomyces astaci]RHZ17749.1 hypothetical protein DYB37_004314 [Aphanomyces astaci]
MMLSKPPPLAPAASASEELARLRVENALLKSQLAMERQTTARLHEELQDAQRQRPVSPLDIRRLKQQVAATKKELARATTKLPRNLCERRILRDYRMYLSTNPPHDVLKLCAKALRGNLKPGMFVYDLLVTQLQFSASSSSSAFPGRARTTFPPRIVRWCESVYMSYGRRAYELLSGEANVSSVGDKRSPSSWSGHMILPSLRMLQRRLAAFRAEQGLSADIGAPNYVSNRDLLKRLAPPVDTTTPATTKEQLGWVIALLESYKQATAPTGAMHADVLDAIEFLTSFNHPEVPKLLQLPPLATDGAQWLSYCEAILRICAEVVATTA